VVFRRRCGALGGSKSTEVDGFIER